MGNAIITNITARPNIKTTMNLVLAQQLPAEEGQTSAGAAGGDLRAGHPMTADLSISFNRFAGTPHQHQDRALVARAPIIQKYLAGIQEMNLAVKERFDAEGISFE